MMGEYDNLGQANKGNLPRGEDFDVQIKNLRHMFTHTGDMSKRLDAIYIQGYLKKLVASYGVTHSELCNLLRMEGYGPVSMDFRFKGAADELYIAFSLETHPVLSVKDIDALIAENPTIHALAKNQLIAIKKIMVEQSSDSLRKNILSIEDGVISLDGHAIPVEGYMETLPIDAADFDSGPSNGYIKALLLFAAGLVNKQFICDDRNSLLEAKISAHSFVNTINRANEDVLRVLYDILGYSCTIPLAFAKDGRCVILQVSRSGSRFRYVK